MKAKMQKEVEEKQILFSTAMVKAILEGRKTQTRRVVKWQPRHEGLNFSWTGLKAGLYVTDCPHLGWVLRARNGGGVWEDKTYASFCPYGQLGSRLWVRETWGVSPFLNRTKPSDLSPTKVYYKADLGDKEVCVWRPSIFMPRWASRITLEITNIRVERLQQIVVNCSDIEAEGLEYDPDALMIGPCEGDAGGLIEAFSDGWDKINGKRKGCSWSDNPFVWVIEFKKL